MMYVLADKYSCRDLKQLAARKFGLATPFIKDDDQRLDAIRLVFNSTPNNDDLLRAICCDFFKVIASDLGDRYGRDKVSTFLSEVPGLAVEIATSGAIEMGPATIDGCSCRSFDGRCKEFKGVLGHYWDGNSSMSTWFKSSIKPFWC